MKNVQNKKHIRNDLILAAALLLLAAMGAVYLFCFRDTGSLVEVTVDGKLYGTYRLSEDRVEDIITGDQNNRLVIRDGKATVEAATCPDKLCVSHRAIFREGESIVCLPHRVVITVVAGGNP
jgi:hypothetical protein